MEEKPILRACFFRKKWLVSAVLVVVCLSAGAGYCGITTVSYQVSASADDGFAWSATEQDISSGYLMIGDGKDYSAPYYMSAMRFASVAIPRSALITDARLKINSGLEENRGQIYGIVRAEAADDAADFISRYIADANKTSASVSWDHKFNWDASAWYTSPDISNVVQGVVDRQGWNCGNSIAIFYSTQMDSGKSRKFVSSEAGSGAVLEIQCEVYKISGYITALDGNGTEGIVVSGNEGICSSVTDVNGYYELLIPAGWSGSVTPNAPGLFLTPKDRSYEAVAEDQLDQWYFADTSPYGGGRGTAGDPYLIFHADQLNRLGLCPNDWDKHFKFIEDIDLSKYEGIEFNIIGEGGSFDGVIDGDGNTIVNFTYSTNSAESYIGLVSVLGVNGIVENLLLENAHISATNSNFVGVLVGSNRGITRNCRANNGIVDGNDDVGGFIGTNRGVVENCNYVGDVTGNSDVGGMVGRAMDNSMINASYVDANVIGNNRVGSLVGISGSYWHGTQFEILNCSADGTVLGSIEVGGLVGNNNDYGIISGCCSTSNVTGSAKVGGLVGLNDYLIDDCYAMGSVSGTQDVGGLVGLNDGVVDECYSTGQLSGSTYVGGLVGRNTAEEWEIKYSFWDIDTSGRSNSAGGTGKTTSGMRQESTFINWGCKLLWTIDEGNDYPRLWWQDLPGNLIGEDWFSGRGTGETNDPYLIETADELTFVGQVPCLLERNFKLIADINLGKFTGAEFNIIGSFDEPFKGVFDGNGHTISNFTYEGYPDYVGLFGRTSGQVENIVLFNPYVRGAERVGALVGEAIRLSNCSVLGGFVKASDYVGGLAGVGSTINNCSSSAEVEGHNFVGGLVGSSGGITNSHASGPVTGNWRIGGLVGHISSAPLTNCYATGNVSATSNYCGGLVGYVKWANIENCYASGNIFGRDQTGGLVGTVDDGVVSDCYSLGDVQGSGVVG
ncbi:MAG: GLUG motif-containing protein [Planctomycetota bacterium]|jgi:hypothetical protein